MRKKAFGLVALRKALLEEQRGMQALLLALRDSPLQMTFGLLLDTVLNLRIEEKKKAEECIVAEREEGPRPSLTEASFPWAVLMSTSTRV